ncbi:hypothetical protein EYZ11_009371 [Aspergillus tanneri]|uniref:Translation initiation factor 5A C-terminal domain-containing protein n=1 Tax=Aspergillus tanneri TaxID=1220188 RepID=A0A4S3JA62_9EURO|nr:hypothetical protein EYZ11_009371 [Aspergillus tanneri]
MERALRVPVIERRLVSPQQARRVFRVVVQQFERHSRKDAQRTANLDFDARVPIPFSVFPSSYRSDAVPETTLVTERVEGEVNLDRTSRVEREDTRTSAPLPDPRSYGKEEVDFRFQSDSRATRRGPDEYTVVQEARGQSSRYPEVDLTRERYREPSVRFQDQNQQIHDKALESQLDITEREYRRRTSPTYDVNYSYDRRSQGRPVESYEGQRHQTTDVYDRSSRSEVDISYDRAVQSQDKATTYDSSSRRPQAYVSYDHAYQSQPVDAYREDSYSRRNINVESVAPAPAPSTNVKVLKSETVIDHPRARKMGYYDDDGNYHSFRRGVERAADRILHPLHHNHHHHDRHDREEVVVAADDRGPVRFRDGVREDVRIVEPRGGSSNDSVPIPCHFIRIGDILILQGRPCQVIRISVSPQTGQHRYLGVDLFTRQLQEESSFISNPSPSVVVQTMLGPVYKTYRILDLRDDGHVVAMTETGDVKQGLPVVPQGHLFRRIRDAFEDGRGSVRALVINDGGRELVVDYKVIHASRL